MRYDHWPFFGSQWDRPGDDLVSEENPPTDLDGALRIFGPFYCTLGVDWESVEEMRD